MMNTKVCTFLFIIIFCTNFTFAQHENDNWRFGNNNWKFDNSVPNGFTPTTNLNPNIRYTNSVISDKNTGELLFYCNGYKIYNRNNQVMTGGDQLFGYNAVFEATGNPSDQSSIILPLPNSVTKYYVFYINGNRTTHDQAAYGNNVYNYGLRYAVVDMSLGTSGLGEVISSNNVLFNNLPTTPPVTAFTYDNSTTNALTSTIGSDGVSYWVITAKDGNILSYKLNAAGLNTTPILSPANYGSFIKISSNSKKLFTRKNNISTGGVYLADFNNTTGTVSNQTNIIPNNLISSYVDEAYIPNSGEFSPDDNILYFIASKGVLCCGIVYSGLAMYNISTGSLKGYNNSIPNYYDYPLQSNGTTAALQRATDGKIYLIQNYRGQSPPNEPAYKPVLINDSKWLVINTPNIWNPPTNPLTVINTPTGTKNGFSFPQLIPSLVSCPDNLNIDYQLTTSQNFQAEQFITASSAISDGLTVNYKAGQRVSLLQGFHVTATENSLFRAYIERCDSGISSRNNNASESRFSKESQIGSLLTSIKIYPNPSTAFINIDSGGERIRFWELSDITGKIILKGSSNQIDVRGLVEAIYILKINTLSRNYIKKVIVK